MLSPRDPVIGGMVRTSGRMTPGGMRPDRRWSESAIPRIGKPRLRRIGPPAPTVTLRPDAIAASLEWPDSDVIYVGGGGQDTLRDQSDSTYVTADYDYDTSTFSPAVATFEAASIPGGATIESITFTMRVRGDGVAYASFDLAGDILGGNSYEPYYLGSGLDPVPGSGWTNLSWTATPSNTDWWWEIPTVAALNAGGLQLHCGVGIVTPGVDGHIDWADAWIAVTVS